MHFKKRTLNQIADMICGNFDIPPTYFRYRSSSFLTEFFQDAGTDFVHNGSTRVSSGSNTNVAEVYNQVSMMLGHEIFDPEIGKRVLVDHAFIVAGGEITKAARNWLGNKLDASKRSQVMFMDRDDILNLFVAANMPLPPGAVVVPELLDDDLPF